MSWRAVALLALGGVFAAGAFWLGREKSPDVRILPAKESPVTVATTSVRTAPNEVPADDIATADFDRAATSASDGELDELFGQANLPATAKAHLIDAALQRQDSRLLSRAEALLRKMIASGTVADVLAAIPKISYFAVDTANEIATLQESLCRFQTSSEDEFGFEMIKVKFNMVLGKVPNVKPWPAVCGAI